MNVMHLLHKGVFAAYAKGIWIMLPLRIFMSCSLFPSRTRLAAFPFVNDTPGFRPYQVRVTGHYYISKDEYSPGLP